jgi:uncharacterized protein
MDDIRFEWDEKKNRQNIRKHGVSFEEAQSVFLDDHAMRFSDPDHSEDEDRFLMLGLSFTLRVLVVCHCYRERDVVIRIISARKATRQERVHYGRWHMRAQYDFSTMKGQRNPYRGRLKQPITIRLDKATVAYFKGLADEIGMPYQNLINLYLRDCALHQKKLDLRWAS